jgi:hypothetical protein
MAGPSVQIDLKAVIDPHSFWVAPIRGLPLSPEVERIISLESQLKILANESNCRVNKRTVLDLKEGLVVGVTVNP